MKFAKEKVLKNKTKEKLNEFGNLSYEEREQIILKMPKKSRAWIYARHASKLQLDDLIAEWVALDKWDMIRALYRQIKKCRRVYYNQAFKDMKR